MNVIAVQPNISLEDKRNLNSSLHNRNVMIELAKSEIKTFNMEATINIEMVYI